MLLALEGMGGSKKQKGTRLCAVVSLNASLQIIQDINALKRLLRQAESNYHALYR